MGLGLYFAGQEEGKGAQRIRNKVSTGKISLTTSFVEL